MQDIDPHGQSGKGGDKRPGFFPGKRKPQQKEKCNGVPGNRGKIIIKQICQTAVYQIKPYLFNTEIVKDGKKNNGKAMAPQGQPKLLETCRSAQSAPNK